MGRRRKAMVVLEVGEDGVRGRASWHSGGLYRIEARAERQRARVFCGGVARRAREDAAVRVLVQLQDGLDDGDGFAHA